MERGQTPQDYAVGVSIMLLTLIAVFTFIPGVFQPFEAPVETHQQSFADGIADRLVADHVREGASNTLGYDELDHTLDDEGPDENFSDFRDGVGVDDRLTNLNVRVYNGSEVIMEAGENYSSNRGVAASSKRIVRLDNRTACPRSCRLVVRVW
jgi:hypothetical protein